MDFICEPFDQMQRAFDLNGFNDHQLHCVLRFDFGAMLAVCRTEVWKFSVGLVFQSCGSYCGVFAS